MYYIAPLLFGLAYGAIKEQHLVVFGDSLSDIGNIEQVNIDRPRWDGRFSNGPVYTEYLAEYTNRTMLNYAFGSAVSNNTFIKPLIDVPSVQEQIHSYEKVFKYMKIDSNDVAIIGVGSNDILIGIVTGKSDIKTFTEELVSNIMKSVMRVHALGYRKLVILGIPSLSVTPEVAILPNRIKRMFDQMVTETNKKIEQEIKNLVTRNQDSIDYIRMVNLFDIFHLVIEPNVTKALGISDYKHACYEIAFGKLISQCEYPDEHAFIDSVHPNTKLHALIGAVCAEILADPGFNITQLSVLESIKKYKIDQIKGEKGQLFPNKFFRTKSLPVKQYTATMAEANSKQILDRQIHNDEITNTTTKSSASKDMDKEVPLLATILLIFGCIY
ncbi:GDSL esterase/lipase [Smittium mucronatum]|uniref:GDSL esterase/lipase n=1 Tax=Smittium mucronatum TaxID=133383 RepID=A0A1R0GXK8_9FUNG|nr:GDSL esterase/lipase [Smittium mucronatum]